MYLLDTNVISEIRKGQRAIRVKPFFNESSATVTGYGFQRSLSVVRRELS